MKKNSILFLFFLFVSIHFAHSQDSIKLNGKHYKMELVDSSKFKIEGWWRLIDIQYILDNGMPNLERKWDKQQLGDMANFSDSVFAMYSAKLGGIGLTTPLYKLSYQDSVQELDGFNQRFPNKLLFVSVFLKDIEGPFLVNYILNPNLMVVFSDNQAIYYERILDTHKINYNGWKEENGWSVVNYVGKTISFNTFLSQLIINNPTYELEYIFYPQKSCPITNNIFGGKDFEIFCYENFSTLSYYVIDSIRQKNYLPIKGKISGNKFKNNLIRFRTPTCNLPETWKLMWRVKRKEGK